MARQRKYRFFVEDDWEKAAKLAYICDVVVLIDQPYNRPNVGLGRDGRDHPSNVVRAQSWDELYRVIRRLS